MLTGLPTGPPLRAMPLNANRIHHHGYRSGPFYGCAVSMADAHTCIRRRVRGADVSAAFVLGVCV